MTVLVINRTMSIATNSVRIFVCGIVCIALAHCSNSTNNSKPIASNDSNQIKEKKLIFAHVVSENLKNLKTRHSKKNYIKILFLQFFSLNAVHE